MYTAETIAIRMTAWKMLIKSMSTDYIEDVFKAIADDIVEDVLETSGISEGDGFSDGDVALAIGRVLKDKLCK